MEMYRKTRGYRVFSAINHTFIAVLAIICVLPLVHVLAISLSSAQAANAKVVTFWPVQFTLYSYERTIGNPNFLRSLWISLQRTSIGTVLSLTAISMAAYPLSKTDRVMRGRTAIAWYFVFPMLFTSGLIPVYLVVLNLGLLNSLWALILPKLVIPYNLVLLLNFFRSIPEDYDEAAYLDGANYFQILFRIYVPLSMPAVATLALFTMVWHWNQWLDGMIFMSDYRNYPFATFLRQIVVELDFTNLNLDPEEVRRLSQRALNASQIMLGTLPILLVYPFLQRYFVKGINLGGVKG